MKPDLASIAFLLHGQEMKGLPTFTISESNEFYCNYSQTKVLRDQYLTSHVWIVSFAKLLGLSNGCALVLSQLH